MDLKRFVRVIAAAGETRLGTGYFLHGDRVLTARHVVENARTVSVQYDDLAGRRVQVDDVEIRWKGEGELDVAVLAVETDLRIARQRLDPTLFDGDPSWRSRGWSAAARAIATEDPRIAESMSGLSGIAYEIVEGAKRFELTVDAPSSQEESWRGISGAPVFCDWRLTGMIGEAPEDFGGGRLGAVPISALWNDPGFREAVGYDDSREQRRRELVVDLTTILTKSEAAALAITAEHDAWQGILEKEGPGALAQALCDASSWRTVVKAFHDAHEKMCRRDAAKAHTVVEILDRVLPEVYGVTELHALPGAAGGQLITLPIETKTLAEIAMAAFDGRHLAFTEVEDHRRFPVGQALFQLAGDQAEQGFDFKQEQVFREWILLLAQWLELDKDDARELRRPERFDDILPLLNRQIEDDIGFGEPRRYFLFTSSFRESHHLFLEQIRQKLPALHLVELAAKTRVDERIASTPLKNILFRSYQARINKT